MPIPLNKIEYGNLLEKNYESALKLRNRYSFINANIFPILSDDEKDLLTHFQKVCRKNKRFVEKQTDDVYPTFEKFGKEHMVQRLNTYDGIKGSAKHQMLLNFAYDPLSPEIELAITASGILAGNALYHNPKRTDFQEKALEELYAGTKVGSLGMTEMERGSDAVNMLTEAELQDDGSVIYNGTKIYNTNGAVADYIMTYGVTDISAPRRSMMFTCFERENDGIDIKRLHIPAAPGVGIAKVDFNDAHSPADHIMAPPGEGYRRLFRGLTPERIAIIGGGIAGLWNAIAHGIIFAQTRYQFGKRLFKYQGISHVLGDLYARAAAFTSFAFNIADMYDKRVGHKIHAGEKPDPMDEQYIAILAAQGKYLTALLAHKAAYEVVQTMGGRGAIDEPGSSNVINRLENLSRIQEVIGGHRNIQMMIINAGLKGTTAMAGIGGNKKRAKKYKQKRDKKVMDAMIKRANDLLEADAEYIPDGTQAKLEKALKNFQEAKENNIKTEIIAYSKAIPRALKAASKAAYKAKKKAK